ncbi:MAG TPA: PolC-type DNA polymerase III, partial [Desulfobacteria bacterium]|nr:PolC-type DNA polymerase III [Desulfobacteria bacterium]
MGQPAFFDSITWEQFPPATAEVLRKASLKRVDLIKSQHKWVVHLSLPQIVNHQDLAAFGRNLLSLVDGINQVEVVPSFEGWKITLEDLFNTYREYLITEFTKRIPALASVAFHVNGQTINLWAANEASLHYLHAKKADQYLQDYFIDTFALKPKVSIELNPEAENPETIFSRTQATEQELLAKVRSEEAKSASPAKARAKSEALYGRPFSGDPVPLHEIQDEEKSVIVQGEVFGLETRALKSGRTLLTFNISDNTDSLQIKIFESEKDDLSESGAIKESCWLKIRGSVQYDEYARQLTMIAKDLVAVDPPMRLDEAEEKRIELHLHTKMSSMDGLSSASALVNRAAKWGHAAVAVTDHGVVQAFPEAYDAADRAGIKLIYGVEAYLVDDDPNLKLPLTQRRSRHCIFLVKDSTGLYNLYQLITKSHLEFYHRTPRVPKSVLQEFREGMLIGSACEAGELITAYLDGADWETLCRIAKFYDYLEIQPVANNEFMLRNGKANSIEDLRDINRTIVKLGEELNLPVVATGDVHFLDPEDEIYRRILLAGKGFEDADKQTPLYLKTTTEMLEEFAYLGEAKAREVVIINPRLIADQTTMLKPFPDDLHSPVISGAEEQIKGMTISRAGELYGTPLPEVVQKRIDKELNSIITHGFAVLYLIAHLLVKKSNEDGYLVGSRGSVGSSLVATFTGITEVNALPPHYRCPKCKYSEFIEDGSVSSGTDLPGKTCPKCGEQLCKDGQDIPFETFLGFKGDKVPDIDLNFSGDYQPRAHKFTEELFGKENVFRAGTIATIAEKTAYGFVRKYLDERGLRFRSAHIDRLVKGCSGVKRTTGQHPGGLMVIPKECRVHDFTPLQRPADDVKSDTITTHFDYHSISGRLVKLDILGHDDPTVIRMLEDLTGVNAKSIPLGEQKTMSLFSSPEALGVKPEDINSQTGTFGIPEFGTKFVRQMLEDTHPQNFSDLVRISGLSHGTDVWLGNAQELVRSGIAGISDIIACRDDIMVYLIHKGLEPGRAFKLMESVRKGKGLKPEDIEEMKANGVPDWYIESC